MLHPALSADLLFAHFGQLVSYCIAHHIFALQISLFQLGFWRLFALLYALFNFLLTSYMRSL